MWEVRDLETAQANGARFKSYCISFLLNISCSNKGLRISTSRGTVLVLTHKPFYPKRARQLPATGLLILRELVLCSCRENKSSSVFWEGQRFSSFWEWAKCLTSYFPGFWRLAACIPSPSSASLRKHWHWSLNCNLPAQYHPTCKYYYKHWEHWAYKRYCKPQVFHIVKPNNFACIYWLAFIVLFLVCNSFPSGEIYVIARRRTINRVYKSFHCRHYGF